MRLYRALACGWVLGHGLPRLEPSLRTENGLFLSSVMREAWSLASFRPATYSLCPPAASGRSLGFSENRSEPPARGALRPRESPRRGAGTQPGARSFPFRSCLLLFLSSSVSFPRCFYFFPLSPHCAFPFHPFPSLHPSPKALLSKRALLSAFPRRTSPSRHLCGAAGLPELLWAGLVSGSQALCAISPVTLHHFVTMTFGQPTAPQIV